MRIERNLVNITVTYTSCENAKGTMFNEGGAFLKGKYKYVKALVWCSNNDVFGEFIVRFFDFSKFSYQVLYIDNDELL